MVTNSVSDGREISGEIVFLGFMLCNRSGLAPVVLPRALLLVLAFLFTSILFSERLVVEGVCRCDSSRQPPSRHSYVLA